jgi:AAA domain
MSEGYDPLENARYAVEHDPLSQLSESWLERTSDLLREPDPGHVPFVVEELLVDQAIAAIVGSWKVGKTYSLLEIALSVVTGREAFGRYAVPIPGPVVLVLEESGRAAYHRRIDRLSRGYAIAPDAVADLHFAANRGVRLDDPRWQNDLLEAGQKIKPRAFLLDPLARLKGATVDESSQREIGPVLDFMRLLRDESGATVAYVHHRGHQGKQQRGSSDLEGYWESRLSLDKDDSGVRTMTAEHREAESGHSFRFALDFDVDRTNSLRLRALADTVEDKVEDYLREHPDASANDVVDHIGGKRQELLKVVARVRENLEPGGSQIGNHPGTTPSDLPSVGGSPRAPSRGLGTTGEQVADDVVPATGSGPEPPPARMSVPEAHAWECPCGREEPTPGAATPVRTLVSLMVAQCPHCGRTYRPEWRVA